MPKFNVEEFVEAIESGSTIKISKEDFIKFLKLDKHSYLNWEVTFRKDTVTVRKDTIQPVSLFESIFGVI